MGIINFVASDEVPEPSSSKQAYFKKLYTTNWRIITVNKNTDAIETAVNNFRVFEIHHITVEEFLANNFAKGTIEKPFRYRSNLLSCGVCHGNGSVDWIQKVVNYAPPDVSLEPYRYKRNPDHITKFKPLAAEYKDDAVIYGSVPKILDGYEICSNCKGTGINSMRLLKYLEE